MEPNTPDIDIDDEVLAGWNTAFKEFSNVGDSAGISIEAPSIKVLEKKIHPPDSKLGTKIKCHISKMQTAMAGISSIIDAASTLFPMMAPAALIVNSLVWVVQSFGKVSKMWDKIEDFLSRMADILHNVSTISDALKPKTPTSKSIRNCIVQLFSCSFVICKISIEYANHGFRAWLDTNTDNNPLDKELSRLSDIDCNLRQTIGFATFAVVDQIERKLDEMPGRVISHHERNAILNCLSSTDFLKTYNSLYERVKFQPNAGKWLLRSNDFINWRDGSNNKLWYRGKPGAGKSVLATIAIRHLQTLPKQKKSGEESAVAFLYLSYKNEVTVDELLGSIARQLISRESEIQSLPPTVKVILQEHINQGIGIDPTSFPRPSTDNIERIISAFATQRRVYIVVDAMDECKIGVRNELMKHLRRVEGDLKLMVTSRLLENQQDLCRGFQQHEIEAHGDDIEGFISTLLEDSHMLKKYERDIQDTVKRKAKGIFLLARLHMDALMDVVIESRIHKELELLPSTIEEGYQNAMIRINNKTGDRGKFAYDIMAWASYATRPLSLKELQFAIAVKGLEDESDITKMLFPASELSPFCCGLVVKDEVDTVRFVHYSARDYFMGHKEELFPDYHLIISFSCVKYLSSFSTGREIVSARLGDDINYDGARDGYSNFDNDMASRYPSYLEDQRQPFVDYAAGNLHKHYEHIRNLPGDFIARGGKSEPSHDGIPTTTQFNIAMSQLTDSIGSLLNEEYGRNLYLSQLWKQNQYFRPAKYLDVSDRWYYGMHLQYDGLALTTQLHLAVFLGCSPLVDRFISSGLDINALDSFDQPALVISLKRSFDDIAATLLHHGATADLSTKRGHVLLLYAAQRDYDQAVDRIISSVADKSPSWSLGDAGVLLLSPVLILLHIAGHLIILSALAEFCQACARYMQGRGRQDPKSRPEFLGNLLFLAYTGETEALKRQLHMLEEFESTDLGSQAFHSEVERIETISNDTSDESDNESDIDTPYSMTADQEIQSKDFLKTACFLALERHHISIVEMLLSTSVDVNSQDHEGQTLLHRATFRNDFELVGLLIEKGAEVDKQDFRQRTALTANADMHHEKVLKLLLRNNANIHLTGSNGIHEIYKAAAHGRTDVVKFFLSNHVSPSIYGDNGWTPLHAAAANGHLECVKLLIEYKAKPSPISDTGRTPLDFVRARETHYDIPLLGESSEECKAYRNEHENFQDMDTRMEEIEEILIKAGALTSDQLYKTIGEKEFKFGEGGKYTHRYYDNVYAEEINALAASKQSP